jgi:hypothetical protein
VEKNYHKPNVNFATCIFNGHGLAAICHSSEDPLLHHMDNNAEDNTDG